MYTVDALTAKLQWQYYFNSIWRGIERTWGKTSWRGGDSVYGWGCGFWENALQEVVRNYTVGIDGQIGGALSWVPSNIGKANQDRLANDAEDHWEASNAYTQIIEPALERLAEAQRWYMDNSTLAAYLPIEGGVNADPLVDQPRIMGAMREGNMGLRNRFNRARQRILDGHQKYEVRLRDVLDPVYRKQIEDAGGGTGQLGFSAKMPGEPRPYPPQGGIGLSAEVRPMFPPDFGDRIAALGIRDKLAKIGHSRTLPYVTGALAVGSATALSYYYWDEIADFLGKTRRRLPGG